MRDHRLECQSPKEGDKMGLEEVSKEGKIGIA
jgi:hypothetical protein